jgi:pimeloyl-ACP methyl ester carboxylesterase
MRRAACLLVLVALAAGIVPARADHVETIVGPAEPRREFPKDFLRLLPIDKQARSALSSWQDAHVGGWGGGACPAGHRPRRPVVFVHGNSVDAWFWNDTPSGDGTTIVNVRQKFLDAGYCARELWAISYTGQAAQETGGSGYFTYADVNADEVYRFIEAVRTYTGARTVDVVSHSLGVTVVRRAAFLHRDLYKRMTTFVAIAGANQGTTTCRGQGTAHVSHVCEEHEPGSAWLAKLNSIGETPKGPRYLTILDGSGLVDQNYLGPDALSPQLKGACNVQMQFTAHNSLARAQKGVAVYLPFLAGASCKKVGGSR